MSVHPSLHGPRSHAPARSRSRPQGGSAVRDLRPKRLQREAPVSAPSAALQTTRRHILIVDRSPATREAVAELLRDYHYVAHAADGMGQTVRLCSAVTAPPELAVLEFRLWDGRGDLAAAWLRARWPNMFILYFSCLRPEHDDALRLALRVPATAVLFKPTSLAAILEMVAHAGLGAPSE